jgi:hypothetical protein
MQGWYALHPSPRSHRTVEVQIQAGSTFSFAVELARVKTSRSHHSAPVDEPSCQSFAPNSLFLFSTAMHAHVPISLHAVTRRGKDNQCVPSFAAPCIHSCIHTFRLRRRPYHAGRALVDPRVDPAC